jgi:type IV secretion system protein VirB10
MRRELLIAAILASAVSVPGQAQSKDAPADAVSNRVEIPAGTRILLTLRSAVSTSSAREGDGVYLESAFPVAAGGRVVIPEGTAFQGVIASAQRSGRIKGRATLQMRVERMIYSSGYAVEFASAVQSTPGSDRQTFIDNKGTMKAESTRGRDALLAAGAGLAGGYAGTATGALGGTLANGSPRVGGAIGGGTGAALGLLAVIAMRGREIRLEPGAMTEVVLQAPLTVDLSRIGSLEAHHQQVQSQPTERVGRARPVRPRLPVPLPKL